MTRINLPRKFHLRDTITLDDPLGMGWVWTLRYFGNPDHVEYQKGQDRASAFDPFIQVQQKFATLAAMEAGEKNLKGKAFAKHVRERTRELYEENLADVDIGKMDLDLNDPKGFAFHVVADIAGVEESDDDGETREVEYTPALGEQVLTLVDPLPEEVELVVGEGDEAETLSAPAGQHLGVFYCNWIRTVTTQLDRFRMTELEEAGKAFAASSGGG